MQHNQIGSVTDAVILGFLLLQTFLGWRRGFLWQAASVASVAFGVGLGWFVAPLVSPCLMERVTSDPFQAKVVVFIFVIGCVGFLVRMIAACAEVRSEHGLPRQEREARRKDDRILGGIFGALKGCVLVLLIVAAGVSCSPESTLWKQSRLAVPLAVAGSRLLPEGAVQEVKRWGMRSARDMSEGLDIH